MARMLKIVCVVVLALSSVSMADFLETWDTDQAYPITNPVTADVTVIGGGRSGVWNTPMASSTPDGEGVRDLQAFLQGVSTQKAGSVASFAEAAGAVIAEFDWRPGASSTRLYVHTRGDSSTAARAGIFWFVRSGGSGPYIDSNVDIDNDIAGGYCGDDNGTRYAISLHEDTINTWVAGDIYHVKITDDGVNHTWEIDITQVYGSGSGTYRATGLTDIGGVTQWAHSSRQVTLSGGSGDNWLDDFSVTQIPEPATVLLLGCGAALLRRRK